MKAFVAKSPETAPSLIEIDATHPTDGEVSVAIAACGLNFADLLLAKGQYQEKRPHPVTLGMELSGTITALGASPGILAAMPGKSRLSSVQASFLEFS